MGMEGWFKKKEKPQLTMKEQRDKNFEEDERAKKIGIGVAALGATAAGAIGGAHLAVSEHPVPSNAPVPNFDTMPVDHVNPTAGKMPGDAPEPITVPTH